MATKEELASRDLPEAVHSKHGEELSIIQVSNQLRGSMPRSDSVYHALTRWVSDVCCTVAAQVTAFRSEVCGCGDRPSAIETNRPL